MKAIRATGRAVNCLDCFAITIYFEDGSTRVLENIRTTLRQLLQLSKSPDNWRTILGISE